MRWIRLNKEVFKLLSIKFYIDIEKDYIHKMIDFAIENNLGLEFQMLHGDSKELMSIDFLKDLVDGTKFFNAVDRLLHLNNYNTFGTDIDNKETLSNFEIECNNARQLGVKKVVMHYSDKALKENITDSKLKSDLLSINNLAKKYDLNIHIENTLFSDGNRGYIKANVDFYDKMFDCVIKNNLSNIGFCLDLGHAKVFSDSIFSEWLALLDKLKLNNIPLHFHLHNNGGDDDAHLPFHITEGHGFNKGDNFTSGLPYLEILRTILNKYDNAMQVMEIQPKFSIDEINWLKANL